MNRDETKTFDSRIIERNIRKGLITRKDVDKHIKALPDRTDHATWSSITDDSADDFDDVDE